MKFACSLAFVATVVAATPALAQDTETNRLRDAPLRRYVAAVVGAAAVGTERVPTIAAEYGESITRNSQAYVALSYFDNVMTDRMRDNLLAAAETIRVITGASRTFSGRDRALAFTAGGKYVVGTSIRPYVGAGAGALNIRRTITEVSLGDVTQAFAEQTGFGDGVVSAGSTEATKPMAEVVAGVGFVTRNMVLDVGYRYRRAFHTATTLDFSQVAVGIGAKW
jgi:opacity protein-like surface antigen